MKRIWLLMLLIFLCIGMFAQNEGLVTDYEYSKFRFVGYENSMPVFQCNYRYDEPLENAVNFALYRPKLNKKGFVSFKFIEDFKIEHGVYFLNNNYLAYRKSKGKDIYIKKEDSQEEYHVEKIGDINIDNRTHYLTQRNYFYFSTEIKEIDYLARIDLEQENPEMEVLPIKGREPILLDNWLYYTIAYKTSEYGVGAVSTIYRIQVDEWRNPELLIDFVEFSGAVINENLLSFTLYDQGEFRAVTYKHFDSTYIEKQISSLIKYKGKKYQETICKNPETGKTQYCYKEVPELPTEFPHKLERKIEANQNYLYLPHTQKPFIGTFITDSLLFFAGKEELQKLSRAQLRKLRNAFYAREGYDFNSEDLKIYFSQFEWYTKTLERRKAYNMTNEDIYIPPADMERIKLIQEVEKNK